MHLLSYIYGCLIILQLLTCDHVAGSVMHVLTYGYFQLVHAWRAIYKTLSRYSVVLFNAHNILWSIILLCF